MPSSAGGNQSANPYERYDAPVEDDLIDPDEGTFLLQRLLYEYT
jgi:hypothetical protein